MSKLLLVLLLSVCFVLPVFSDDIDRAAIRLGATDHGDGYVTFALYTHDSAIKEVYVFGDFNNWDEKKDKLEVSSDGKISFKKVKVGKGETRYKFIVNGPNGKGYISDPYALEIDDNKDNNAIINVGASKFRWSDSSWRAPNMNDLIIYELHPMDFAYHKMKGDSPFVTLRKNLDYIKNMGVNAIELMPIYEMTQSFTNMVQHSDSTEDYSWGYNPCFFFAPEKAYGTPDELKQLINDAHNKGIAIILDVVLNHLASEHPYNQMWLYNRNPFMSTDGNEWGLPDLNHWSDATKRFEKDFVEFWLKEYHVDGYRFDYTRGIGYDGNSGVSYITWAARQCKSNVYLIAEHLPQDPHIVLSTEIDSIWHDTFHDQMKANLREGQFQGNHYKDLDTTCRAIHFAGDGFTDNAQVINYTESHDEERVIFESRTNSAIDWHLAVKKSKLGIAAVMTASGIPMIYSGQEMGMDLRIRNKYPKLTPIEWHRLNSYPGDQLYSTTSSLSWLRRKHPALRLNNCEFIVKDGYKNVLAYKRWDGSGDVVIVALNFSRDDQSVNIPMPYNGKWHEYVFNYSPDVNNNNLYESIPGNGYKIFCLKKTW